MEVHDIHLFMALMANQGELYGKPISGHLTELYWQTLKRFEWQDVKRTFEAHVNNPDSGQFFPKPADIIRFIEGSGETKALKAWAKVEKTIGQVGSYQSVAFEDCIIHAVIEDMGGWIKLCTTTFEELPFKANEFQKRYIGFLEKKPLRYPKYLVGIAETTNAKNGYDTPSPLLIGDPKKAKAVIGGGGGDPLSIEMLNRSITEIMQLPYSTEDDVE